MGLFKKRPYISLKQTPVDVVESEKAPMIQDGKWIQ
ncbi:MAG: acetyl-CoA carboxylase carboxyl transferase subunit beta, partial [Granulicatella sp.]|nr:acetyl-CoA carboxylase carboxyl transferase subunit beta [Granulicatella sp.]